MKNIMKKMFSVLNTQGTKKGVVGGFMSVVIGLGIGVVTIVVLAIMLGALQTSQTANSLPYNITGDGLTFLDNTTSQFGTAGTILGVSLLLLIIAGVGLAGYMGYQKYGKS